MNTKIKSKNLISYLLSLISKREGFTLIELLIVVTIIGVLSTLLTTNFIAIRQRTRDGQRKSDIKQIQSSLEIYRADNNGYPPTSGQTYRLNSNACPTPSSLTGANGTPVYMQKIPCEPLGVSSYNSGNYYYYSNGTSYTLAACLENENDDSKSSSAPSPAATGDCDAFYMVTNP